MKYWERKIYPNIAERTERQRNIRYSTSRPHFDVNEFYKFIGLQIFMGIVKVPFNATDKRIDWWNRTSGKSCLLINNDKADVISDIVKYQKKMRDSFIKSRTTQLSKIEMSPLLTEELRTSPCFQRKTFKIISYETCEGFKFFVIAEGICEKLLILYRQKVRAKS